MDEQEKTDKVSHDKKKDVAMHSETPLEAKEVQTPEPHQAGGFYIGQARVGRTRIK